MSLVGFHARNHRQQVGKRGADPRVDDRATTLEDFGPLHERFGFTVDVEPFRDRGGHRLSVEFLPGRLRFIAAGKTEVGPNERPPFGCCLVIWKGGLS